MTTPRKKPTPKASKPEPSKATPAAKTPVARAPRATTAAKVVDEAPAPEKSAPVSVARKTAKYNVTRPVKKADTFRLPLDAHKLIRAEVEAAAENGDRVTKDDAVTYALRHTFGKKHAARIANMD